LLNYELLFIVEGGWVPKKGVTPHSLFWYKFSYPLKNLLEENMTIGKRVAEKRKENNLTQAALADALNVSTAFVSQIEGDLRKPSYKVLIDIAHKLNSTVEYIVSGAGSDVDSPADKMMSFCLKHLDAEKKTKLIDYIFVLSGTKRYKDFPFLTSPIEYANFIVKQFKIEKIPVDVFALADCLGVDIIKSEILYDGILYKNPDKPLIVLNSSPDLYGRERFTLAVLLGNLVIPWHLQPMYYREKYKKSLDHEEPFEMEARQFAGELLLPSIIVKRDMKEITPSIGALEQLAYNKYNTSLGAVAHKYTEYFGDIAAYATTDGTKITRKYDTKFPYKVLDETKPGSIAYSFIENPPSIKETRSGHIDANLWVSNAPSNLTIYEESMIDPKQNVIVTLLLLNKTKK
jgi:transcriptional regulator with XRE-family HTH domain/Zn-dependent peptidase ImmA (M78 family)